LSDQQQITAKAYIRRLADRGIDYVFANAGTDFAPIIEAISRNAGSGRKIPKFITVPHENVAMAMAHGYYRACGKPAAVMVHVTVGTGNTINGLMNAARDSIPLLLAPAAPRSPDRHIGCATLIHWGQESFDQGAWCANSANGTTSCAPGSQSRRWSTAPDIAMSSRAGRCTNLPREVLASRQSRRAAPPSGRSDLRPPSRRAAPSRKRPI
jgi:acetolactate synthase-1/2/3 large subunit